MDDVVETVIKLITGREALDRAINVGGPEEVSIKNLPDLIKQMPESSSGIHVLPYGSVDDKAFEDMELGCRP